jgi:hypothetical protein
VRAVHLVEKDEELSQPLTFLDGERGRPSPPDILFNPTAA